MRIQFSRTDLGETHIADTLTAEQRAGRIAPHVSFKVLRRMPSARRTADHPGGAYEVQLAAGERDRGRRYGNSGSYGPTNEWAGGSSFAATYDEWGWLLRALYARDPRMLVGTPAHPTYRGVIDFDGRTGWTYHPGLAEWIDQFGDPYPYRLGRNTIGRRGFGRAGNGAAWGTDDPRTAEWARQFYAGEVF